MAITSRSDFAGSASRPRLPGVPRAGASRLVDGDTGEGGRTLGEELQALTKLDGMFNGMVGYSFNHDHGFSLFRLQGLAFGPLTDVASKNDILTKSNSAFAELYVTPVDRLKLTTGIRYT
jgi:outer membrane receptor protein involved in Fe transport